MRPPSTARKKRAHRHQDVQRPRCRHEQRERAGRPHHCAGVHPARVPPIAPARGYEILRSAKIASSCSVSRSYRQSGPQVVFVDVIAAVCAYYGISEWPVHRLLSQIKTKSPKAQPQQFGRGCMYAPAGSGLQPYTIGGPLGVRFWKSRPKCMQPGEYASQTGCRGSRATGCWHSDEADRGCMALTIDPVIMFYH
jgi:hypothetical protein